MATTTVLKSGVSATVGGITYTVGSTTTINGTNYTTNIVTVTGTADEFNATLSGMTETVNQAVYVQVVVYETNGNPGVAPQTFTATNNVALVVNFVPQSPSITTFIHT